MASLFLSFQRPVASPLDHAHNEAQIGERNAAFPAAAGQIFEQGVGFIEQRPEGSVRQVIQAI